MLANIGLLVCPFDLIFGPRLYGAGPFFLTNRAREFPVPVLVQYTYDVFTCVSYASSCGGLSKPAARIQHKLN